MVVSKSKGLGLLALLMVGCTGLESGIDYPDNDLDLDQYLLTPEGRPDPSVTLSEFRIGPKACEGIDTHPVSQTLNQEDLTRFFQSIGIKSQAVKARDDLYWYEFRSGDGDEIVRLRLAILPDRDAAAKDLHESLLQHGPGWWGLRRGNLAVLMPKAGLTEALRFAIGQKLVCWGMFTYTGVDDVYVVAGPYHEI
jgi:hypothetical protein